MIDMRERKYVKIKVDMYEDTKFKIIDMKPERDVIHYIWSRLVTLAGKVNCEGELYMSKNIPYTIETLAIEFNRNVEQVKLAVDVFRELEMIEIHEGNVYIVKNFAKHQNIKVKEKIKFKVEEEETNNEEVNIIETSHEQAGINQDKDKDYTDRDKEEKKNEEQNQSESGGNPTNRDELNLHKNNITNVDKNRINNKDSTNSQEKIPISLEKKRKKPSKNKKKEVNIEVEDEEFEDNRIVCLYDSGEERPLEEGESVISAWAF